MKINEEPTVTAVTREGSDIIVELTTVIELNEDFTPMIQRKQTVRVPLAFAKTLVDLATREPEKKIARYICIVCGDTATHVTTADDPQGMRSIKNTYWCEHHTSHPGAVGATRMSGGVPNENDEAPHYQGGPGLKITSYSAVGMASMGKPNNSGGSGVGVKTVRDLFVDLIGTSIDRGVQHFNGIRKVPGTTLDPETKTYTLNGDAYFAPGSVIDDGVVIRCSGYRLNWDGERLNLGSVWGS